jgi:hypothetical protein
MQTRCACARKPHWSSRKRQPEPSVPRGPRNRSSPLARVLSPQGTDAAYRRPTMSKGSPCLTLRMAPAQAADAPNSIVPP